ncbi:menaquinone biosynthesis protein [Marinococcus halophilus]|uniref:Chorismate dehydratase n=1 Tax=Marinococcus halophilus TaxID=1371 RepID=A0A510Y405_MARHA|nr:menaquinone biosynthesis protein [Marinococcus halophilus]GEK57903.1 chorismate dehydratase [Marinococcus halophilus]
MSITMGEIAYTNAKPFFYYLDRQKLLQEGVQFEQDVPASLNRKLEEQKLSGSAVSSFAFGSSIRALSLLPSVCVASVGKVRSILFYSRYPVDELSGRRIALTSTSATSVHLLKIILQEFYQVTEADYQTQTPDPVKMKEQNDAYLLIGDDAIKASWEESDWFQYDLGELWYAHTGLPMVYAVFAVQNDSFQQNESTWTVLYQNFLQSRQKAERDNFTGMAAEYSQQLGGSSAYWQEYFRGLHFTLGTKEQEGLLYYYHLAYKYGYLNEAVESLDILQPGDEVHYLF